MVRGRFDEQSVFDALAWIDMTRSSGALRVKGPVSGALFFVDGRIYFGMTEGHKLTVDELQRAGVSRDAWVAAGKETDGDRTFAERLVDLGTPPEAVRAFVWNRIVDVVGTFAELSGGEFSAAPGRHGFGSTVSFCVDDVVRAVRRGMATAAPECSADSLVSLRPSTVDVKITADDWNTLVSLISPVRFAELVEKSDDFSANHFVSALAADGLVSVVSPDGEQLDTDGPETIGPPPAEPLEDDDRPVPLDGDDDRPVPLDDDDGNRAVPLDGPDDTDDGSPPDPRHVYAFGGESNGSQPDDLPDTFAVGRDTYAAMSGLRASTIEHDTQAKTSALRRLIDAVRGL